MFFSMNNKIEIEFIRKYMIFEIIKNNLIILYFFLIKIKLHRDILNIIENYN